MNVRVGVHTSDQDTGAAMTTVPTKTDTSSIRTLHAQPHNRLPSFPTKLGLVVQQIDKIIHDLEETVSEASSPYVPPPLSKKRSTQNIKSRKEPGNTAGKESKEGHSKKDDSTNSLFGLFHRRTSAPRQPSDDSSSVSSINPVPEEHQLPAHTSSPVASTHNDTPLSRLTGQIASLRTQHSLLMSLIEGDNIVPTTPSSLPAISSLIFNTQSLATYTDEGMEQRRQADHRSTSGEMIRSSSSLLSLGELTRRRSLATLGSTGESIWYDAEEGVEFISVETVSHHSTDDDNGSGPGNETNTETMTLDEECPPHFSQISNTSSVSAFGPQPGVKPTPADVARRTHLPSPTSGDEISLFSVLKRNVGKVLASFQPFFSLFFFYHSLILTDTPGSLDSVISC
jgi:oxysterol-binding protein-related protein 3/6/7